MKFAKLKPNSVNTMTTLHGIEMKSMTIIPARLQSGRLPGKPLLKAGGKTLLGYVYGQASRVKVNQLAVASSDNEILDYCDENNMGRWLTRSTHLTGTHRCAEVIEKIDVDVIVNWQCDEPLVDPQSVDMLIDTLEIRTESEKDDIATLVAPWEGKADSDPNVIKTAVSGGYCHWFSRAPLLGSMIHIGVYAFRAETLRKLGQLKPTKLSQAESLEQLAWLEAGFQIRAVEVDHAPLAINTQEDWDQFTKLHEETNDENKHRNTLLGGQV